jgi:hypothetical protein
MRRPWRNLAFSLAACCLSTQAAVLVTLKNGSQVEALSESHDGNTAILTIGGGTVSMPVTDIASIDRLPDQPEPEPTQAAPLQEPQLDTRELLANASAAQAIDSEFIAAVAKVESGLQQNAISNKGAIGLMQLMPGTAADLGVKPENPSENALGGAKYLRELLLRYQGDARLALAAYNAGPGAVERYHGIPPYPETVAYVSRVLREYQKAKHKKVKPSDSVKQPSHSAEAKNEPGSARPAGS